MQCYHKKFGQGSGQDFDHSHRSTYSAYACDYPLKYSLTLVLFSCNWGCILLLRPRQCIISMARAMVLLVSNVQCINTLFAALLTANTASLAVTGDAFHYQGHTHALY